MEIIRIFVAVLAETNCRITKSFLFMKRKDYEKPMTEVVKLQHQSHLLQMSLEDDHVQPESQTWGDDQ